MQNQIMEWTQWIWLSGECMHCTKVIIKNETKIQMFTIRINRETGTHIMAGFTLS